MVTSLKGFWRSHQVPLAGVRKNPAHLKLLEDWMRSYKPEELFDEDGTLVPELRELAPTGDSPDGRKSARQRRAPQEDSSPARLPRLRASSSKSPDRSKRKTRGRWASFCAM